jgi:hypothetical protein
MATKLGLQYQLERLSVRFGTAASGLLIQSFNGKPQALPLDFAYACGSPLNENSFR